MLLLEVRASDKPQSVDQLKGLKDSKLLKVSTPISDLFRDERNSMKITSESDCLECRDKSVHSVLPDQELFHCDIQPIHKLGEDVFNYLDTIARLKPDLRLISFHAATSCHQYYLDGYMAQPVDVQYSRKEMLNNSEENIARIRKIFGPHIEIAIENNNFYSTEAYRHITDTDFLQEIVHENDIYFLFDVAHARITAFNRNMDYEQYKNALPIDKMIQVHISRSVVDENRIAFDAHDIPQSEEWDEVKEIISLNRKVRYLTVEYYKDVLNLVKSLKKVRRIIHELS